jgi:hypothetical protein
LLLPRFGSLFRSSKRFDLFRVRRPHSAGDKKARHVPKVTPISTLDVGHLIPHAVHRGRIDRVARQPAASAGFAGQSTRAVER